MAGQLALVVALALFVAQAINLGLLLRERTALRLEQASGPSAARIVDALEREAAGRPLRLDRGRVRRVATNPIAASLEPRPEVASELRTKLTAMGISAGRIEAATRPTPPRRMQRMRGRGRPPPPTELLIAVEQPGRGWLVIGAPWPEPEAYILWRLLAQTFVLYAIVLFPVLLLARRISRPLQSLAIAARRFTPGGDSETVTEAGPPDVRAVISAYNALGQRVAAMLEEKDRMLGAIGHDLRTPLAALRVRIESVDDDTDRVKMAETIDEMNRTLDDILSLARLGRPSEEMTEVDLAALVDAVVDDFRDLGANVTFDETPRVKMRLRPTLFRRAVRNLIENALKYAGSAEVAIRDDGDRVTVCVADRGPGIPDGQLEAVFDPFTRLETSRNRDTGGIGLGLALARAIVREAGGDIRLSNRDGGGLEAAIVIARR
ncbi:HAMP domain-containing histidine kinase [Sphingomonas sp. SUN019]|uniref:sensor histidine kinase n=1 Tax=Sphingomonas sp. SUN019 TaxID=2937788 RepID=UPI0021646761|nr:HAMP domain-containing sensor histidine kinase [Sphingomonas sp. SUN019]UVO49418.1 HAMP domain-containing histidine kinase [Sphingomonas sp. SUN019]